MPAETIHIEVRMYYVGFGDAFRVTVRQGQRTWRMLVDCGAHFLGRSRPIDESVATIIGDLATDCAPGPPRFDVVVATHSHQDHVEGFASSQWEEVQVGEVWLPFVENAKDSDTKKLIKVLSATDAANRLTALVAARERIAGLDATAREKLALAHALAENSSKTDIAMDRLLGKKDTTFAETADAPTLRRFLTDKLAENNRIEVDGLPIVAHVLGPSRDPDMLKKMRPPSHSNWLALDEPDIGEDADGVDLLFDNAFVVSKPPAEVAETAQNMKLQDLPRDVDDLLSAAAELDDVINNTSVFFVLEVGGLKFLFPGDAQRGAWEHARNAPGWHELINDVAFYKVGHHGSHNATSPIFVDDEWKTPGEAMVPWRRIERFSKIPYKPLMESLEANGHRIVKPEETVEPADGDPGSTLTRDEEGWWSELAFEV